jgi:hypothetical protein
MPLGLIWIRPVVTWYINIQIICTIQVKSASVPIIYTIQVKSADSIYTI